VAIIRIRSRPMSPELYDEAVAMMDLEHDHPLGLIMHGACEVDGRVQVVQVWDSEEYALRFDAERLEPALAAIGAPLDSESSLCELRQLVTP
jgi:hypothetical protein